MNQIRWVFAFLALFVLSACGGGGGSPGTSLAGTTEKTALFTSAPASLTLSSGATSEAYTISGGVAPYVASPDTPSLISVSLSGSTFTISTVAGKSGSGSIVVTDSSGAKITLTVTVPSPATLFSTAPAALQILGGTTNFYTVFGGVAPYVVNGSGPIAKAVLSGDSLAISGLTPGHQTVAVSDAKGTVISIDVTVNQGMYTDAPANLIVASGTGNTYSVFGGVFFSASSPYRINNSNPIVANATIAGSTLSVSGLSSGSATLVISDSVGATILIAVTVPLPGAILTTAPSNLSLATGTSGNYSISGGVGPYTATSANPSLVSVSVTGSSLLIGAVADTVGGTANVIVSDSKGTPPVTIAVTTASVQFFTTAPAQLAIAAGDSKIFAVFGGSAPYSVVNTHPAVVTGVISGSRLAITGAVAGAGSIILNDAKGASVSIAVVVSAPGPLYLSAPGGTVTLASGSSVTYDIIGGVPPYLAGSNGLTIAKGTIVNANQIRVEGLAAGSARLAVTDSAGTQVSFDVKVPGASQMFTTAPTSGVYLASAEQVSYAVYGGLQPYSVTGSNESVVHAILSQGVGSAALVLQAVSGGTANVLVTDAAGLSINIPVTIGSINKFFVTAPDQLAMGAGTSAGYQISGGTRPYTVSSSDTRVANGSVVFSNATSSALQINALTVGTAILMVSDASGARTPITVVVDGTGGTGATAAATIDILASGNSLNSTPGSSISFLVSVKDLLNTTLPKQTVAFSASSGTLSGANPSPVTGAAGTIATVTLSPGADASNRNITVTAVTGSISRSIVIPVVGTTLAVSGPGAALVGSGAQNFTLKAADSSGKPVVGASLVITSALGNGISPQTVVTDSSGAGTVAFTAANVGTDTLMVTGLGTSGTASVIVSNVDFSFIAPAAAALLPVSAANPVTVRYRVAGIGVAGQTVTFSSTRGNLSATTAVTDINGDATVNVSSTTAGPVTVSAQLGTARSSLTAAFVATVPATLVLQANPAAVLPNTAGSTTNQSALTAVVRDAVGNPVQGVAVNFSAITDGSNGSISPGSATTDSNGMATAQFIPGPLSTAANGVQIKATVQLSPLITSAAALTVNGSALFISIARSGTLTAFDSTTYQKDFSVYVTDATGAPAGNRAVTLAVDPIAYGKGSLGIGLCGAVACWTYVAGSPTLCINEDTNRNGVFDAGDNDVNGDGRLQPGIPAVITSSVTTDVLGFATFTLRYGKNYALWVSTQITAKSLVGGTESRQVHAYDLEMTSLDAFDAGPPANQVSPFGVANVCTNPG